VAKARANLARELAGVEMLKSRVAASIDGTRAAVQNLGEKHRRNRDLTAATSSHASSTSPSRRNTTGPRPVSRKNLPGSTRSR